MGERREIVIEAGQSFLCMISHGLATMGAHPINPLLHSIFLFMILSLGSITVVLIQICQLNCLATAPHWWNGLVQIHYFCFVMSCWCA